MIPKYQYRVNDASIFTPPFKKWVVEPLFKFIPSWIPANIITLISNSLMYLAVVLMLFSDKGNQPVHLGICLLIIAYTIGDHFDGMQAKRSKTSSALGEWFDHYLDIFNTGIIAFILISVLEISNPFFICYLIFINYLTHAIIFYEQRKTGWLYFEKIGALESVFMACALIIANSIPSIHAIFNIEILNSIRFIEMVALCSSLGPIISIITIVKRAKIKEANFFLFAALLAILSCILHEFGTLQIILIITLYSTLYIGNLMRGHLINGKKYLPDFIVPSLLLLNYIFEMISQNLLFNLLSLGLSGYIFYQFFSSIYILREYWVWKNPRTEN